MIRKIIKIFCVTILVFFILFSFHIIYKQSIKIKSYENGNAKLNTNDIEKIYNEPTIKIAETDNKNINNFVNCFQSSMDEKDFTDEMKNKYNEIRNLFKKNDSKASFSYECLNSGLHISYNENQEYFCASVIKTPVVTYIYKLYLEGKISLDEVMTYTNYDYVGGSGSIQYNPIGGQYSIKSLIDKSIIESDNVAYQMLSRRLYNTDIRNYWKKLGSKTFWSSGNWGQTSSHDGAIYMKELYKLTKENPKIKDKLLNIHFKSINKLIKLDNSDIKIAHKAGWNYQTTHDIAIVYNEQPYVLAITTRKGWEDYESFFKQATKLINEFHELYWNNKSNYCFDKAFSK